MRIEQLEYFLTVAKYGSLSKAASNIYVGQPTLSAAIASLEEELGKKLFKRTRRGMEMTALAIDLVPLIEKTIEDFYAIKKKAGVNATTLSHLHLITSNACKSAFIEAISRSQDIFPSVHFYLHHQMAGDVMRDILENHAVIGLSSCNDYCLKRHQEYAENAGLRFVTMYYDRLVLFSKANGHHADSETLSFHDLMANEEKVAIPTDLIHQGVFKEQSELANLPYLVSLDDHSSIFSYVMSQDTIGVTTNHSSEHNPLFSSGLLKKIEFKDFPVNIVHYLVYQKNQAISDVEADIIQQIESYYERQEH